jgi:hypothetical protein
MQQRLYFSPLPQWQGSFRPCFAIEKQPPEIDLLVPKLLGVARLYALQTKYDEDLAEQARAGGCTTCGGRLDSARYARKPRGGTSELPDDYQWRFSFCCAVEGCRRRRTPPSIRFLGRQAGARPEGTSLPSTQTGRARAPDSVSLGSCPEGAPSSAHTRRGRANLSAKAVRDSARLPHGNVAGSLITLLPNAINLNVAGSL